MQAVEKLKSLDPELYEKIKSADEDHIQGELQRVIVHKNLKFTLYGPVNSKFLARIYVDGSDRLCICEGGTPAEALLLTYIECFAH